MDIYFLAHLLNGILMVGMPIALAIFLTRRWKNGSKIWWIGAATFVLSQVGHIPFNQIISKLLNQTGMVAWDPLAQLLFNAIFLGLSAGIFEEGTRYLVLRFWARDARSWRTGILFGAGHGGAEAIIIGALALYSFLQLAALRNADLSKIFPASQLALAQSQVLSYWSTPWYGSLLGALERFFTIPCQIAMAVLVMQVFTRKKIVWLFVAIGYHTVIDASAVIGLRYLSSLELEGIVGLFAVVSILIIYFLRQPEPMQPGLIRKDDPFIPPAEPIQESSENLEETRYQ